MKNILPAVAVATAVLAVGHAATPPSSIVSSAGQTAKIAGWNLQSVLHASSDIAGLSRPGADVSNWPRVSPRTTVMAGLIESGLYTDSNLWFSDNLNKVVDRSVFGTPWLYREEFTVNPSSGQHYFLITHGITSKADIWLNGKQLADKDFQEGSYGGHKYEITKFLQSGANAILIQAYETNYLLDSAMGFVDWNPYPPDNGTGVWRDVEISQTGPVSLAPFRFIHDWTPGKASTKITVKVNATNLESHAIDGTLTGQITLGNQQLDLTEPFTLAAHEEKTVSLTGQLQDPQIWWPWLWGDQPLYNVTVTAVVNNKISDAAEPRRVGIRHIESGLNDFGDRTFTVNGQRFLPLGGGYGPDMFMRWDTEYVRKKFELMVNLGMNTIRLEGKQEHPELYDMADEMGLMIMPGWECCDWWEGWTYNTDVPDYVRFTEHDYWIANYSMLHEASMMQTHPSVLAFLVGSDYWPNDRAASIYVNALKSWDWLNPIVASAGELGFPEILGSSGVKMDGPYDYVPPNYWYGGQVGAAFGFGSEEGAGVGTPEIRSLKKFLSDGDLKDLWTKPNKGLFHMSSNVSSFYDRSIYNKALWNRYGPPSSLEDYLLKAQMMDYEANRAEYEGFASLQDASRSATGVIYWMMNGAWPNLHWQLFDYYLNPAGSYFGTKVGARPEHVSFSYDNGTVYLINRLNSLDKKGDASRWVLIDLIDTAGKSLFHQQVKIDTKPNYSQEVAKISKAISKIKDVAFLRLILSSDSKSTTILSRNVYWLSSKNDVLKWDDSTWYYTPISSYADYTPLQKLPGASVTTTVKQASSAQSATTLQVHLENKSNVPAFFIRLVLIDSKTDENINPPYWSDNYVTLFPQESINLTVSFDSSLSASPAVEVSGGNVATQVINV
ncbi:glycosyl hydrolase, putative [Talaromyces stipitatus ATCC 10500]|uniref:Glycosyl hydrolase, putative n=1 Tax=Talaromyces stipitatus (strain ATCC 10500 / CBS 375.48 / QM 6759 / NRRL 1006) TaxID=441959 RepID=B8M4F5_TALSN|nr:glycosyl hydrolase, putative [Talaromyces stipitatus ATCC 10500]EED19150.1 glycosyl hydrolase, putative [Talaromyces stipitatus ATCC 10500]